MFTYSFGIASRNTGQTTSATSLYARGKMYRTGCQFLARRKIANA